MVEAIKPHDRARAEIESWRGRCLDFFAKGEKVIGQTLERIRDSGKLPAPVKLRHLAGQRADDLIEQVNECGLSKKQSKAVSAALAD